MTVPGSIALILAAFSLTSSDGSDCVTAAELTSSRASADALASDRRMPVYVPPKDKVPHARMESGLRGQAANDLRIVALVPDHVGFTTKKDPTLYWYASHATSLPVQFTLTDPRAIRSIAEIELPPPKDAGYQTVRLRDYGISLDPGIQFRWSVSIVQDHDRPSTDLVTGGMIERIEFNEGSALGFPIACTEEAVLRYAEAGLWYDAIGCVSDLIESNPSDSFLRKQRASLLKQINLPQIAEFELRQSGVR